MSHCGHYGDSIANFNANNHETVNDLAIEAFIAARIASAEFIGRDSYGYAWVTIADPRVADALRGVGYSVSHDGAIFNPGNASMLCASEAGAKAFCDALARHGIAATWDGRLD